MALHLNTYIAIALWWRYLNACKKEEGGLLTAPQDVVAFGRSHNKYNIAADDDYIQDLN